MLPEQGFESIDSINDLVAQVEIAGLVLHEERARRLTWSEEERESIAFPLRDDSFGMVPLPEELHYRFRSVFSDENAEYVADVEIVYRLPAPSTVAESVLGEFAERVAFMAVFPFIRASMFSSAARLGLPAPILGIVRQGEFKLGEKMTDAQVKAAFGDNESELRG